VLADQRERLRAAPLVSEQAKHNIATKRSGAANIFLNHPQMNSETM
jgi:hypothetical protein